MTISGNIVDVVAGRIFQGTVEAEGGKIVSVREHPVNETAYILPGLIDAHIHIESSMLLPSEFARLAVVHGTTSTVSDPHEIANVLGAAGVRFMISNGQKVPFNFNFGAPSCVPATPFETAGAVLGPAEVQELLEMKEVKYLSEMMNYPGVIHDNPEVIHKLESAHRLGKPVDGHAPGLRGVDLSRYIDAGISTDHECYTLEEAVEKAELGMKILIREGSAAKNFEALCPLIGTHPRMVMFCSDDKHPDDLAEGHMNNLVVRAINKGFDPVDVLRCCTLNPVTHYALDAGLLQAGDPADIVIVNDLKEFRILEVFARGIPVAKEGKSLIPSVDEMPFNRFMAMPVTADQLEVAEIRSPIRVIRAMDGQLVTGMEIVQPTVREGRVVSDPSRDILKLVVVNRYAAASPAVAFISGIGLKRGAIASCVAHDSHNIVAVGTDDGSLARAINLVVAGRGGISLADGETEGVLELPFAGIMTGKDGFGVAGIYREMDARAKRWAAL